MGTQLAVVDSKYMSSWIFYVFNKCLVFCCCFFSVFVCLFYHLCHLECPVIHGLTLNLLPFIRICFNFVMVTLRPLQRRHFFPWAISLERWCVTIFCEWNYSAKNEDRCLIKTRKQSIRRLKKFSRLRKLRKLQDSWNCSQTSNEQEMIAGGNNLSHGVACKLMSKLQACSFPVSSPMMRWYFQWHNCLHVTHVPVINDSTVLL